MCMSFSKEELGVGRTEGGSHLYSVALISKCGDLAAAYARGYLCACADMMEHCILFCEQLMLLI